MSKHEWNLKHAKWTKPGTEGHIIIWFHLHAMPRIDNSIETENRLEITRIWGGREEWKVISNEYCVSLGVDENVLELVVLFHNKANTLKITKFFTLKG